jgi:hypothetical protein
MNPLLNAAMCFRMMPDCGLEQIRGKLAALKLSNKAVWDREHAREKAGKVGRGPIAAEVSLSARERGSHKPALSFTQYQPNQTLRVWTRRGSSRACTYRCAICWTCCSRTGPSRYARRE